MLSTLTGSLQASFLVRFLRATSQLPQATDFSSSPGSAALQSMPCLATGATGARFLLAGATLSHGLCTNAFSDFLCKCYFSKCCVWQRFCAPLPCVSLPDLEGVEKTTQSPKHSVRHLFSCFRALHDGRALPKLGGMIEGPQPLSTIMQR